MCKQRLTFSASLLFLIRGFLVLESQEGIGTTTSSIPSLSWNVRERNSTLMVWDLKWYNGKLFYLCFRIWYIYVLFCIVTDNSVVTKERDETRAWAAHFTTPCLTAFQYFEVFKTMCFLSEVYSNKIQSFSWMILKIKYWVCNWWIILNRNETQSYIYHRARNHRLLRSVFL